MMEVRFAKVQDMDDIVEMSRENAKTRPGLVFNEVRTRATVVDYLEKASPSMWVCEDKGEVIGLLVADFYVYRAFDGLFTTQEVLFVKPEKRGSRAATLLMRELISWSKMLGAKEIIGGNDNEDNSERTAKFLGHFGFRKVGYAMRMELGDGR